MTATYAVSVESQLDLVRITLAGFFAEADVRAFVAARNDAHRQLRCGPNQHLTLVDIRDMKIQAQEMVGVFQQVLASPEHRSRALAFVVSPTLARTQLMRAVNGRDMCFFECEAEAKAWLFATPAAGRGMGATAA